MAGLEHLQKNVEQEKLTLQSMEAKPDEFGKLDRAYLKALLTYHEEILKGLSKGKKIILGTLGHPSEILWAMDLLPVEVGSLAMMVGGTPEESIERMDRAGEELLMPTTCGFPKTLLGAVASGKYPPIDLLLVGGHPCDPMTAASHVITDIIKAPVFYSDLPRWRDDRAMEYTVAEVKRLIAFLEEHTGRKLDIDRLREVAEESNKATEFRIETNELRKTVPCPQHSYVGSMVCGPFQYSVNGSPIATSLFKEVLDDTTERLRRGEGAVPEEKIRAIWYDVGHLWARLTFDWMEKEWGAVVVMDLQAYQSVSYIDTSSYDTMMRGLADKMFQHCMERLFGYALVDNYINEFIRVYQDYKADCALVLGHNMDRNRGVWRSFVRQLCRERGIPLLMMDYDSFDPRAAAEGAIRYNIEQFFNTVVLH